MAARHGSNVAVLLVALSKVASAEPLPALEPGGNCPNSAELVTALATRTLPAEAREYRVVTFAAQGGVALRIENGEGNTVLERSIESDDCVALADAVALIVETYFVELQSARGAEPTAPPVPEPPKTLASVAPVVAPPNEDPAEAVTDERERATFGLFLGLGAEVFPRDVSWAVEAGAGFRWPRLLVDFRLHTGTATLAGSSPDDVLRWASRVTGRFGVRSSGRLRVEGFLGGGLSVSRLELLSVPASPVRVAFSPVFEAGTGLELDSRGVFSGRVEAGCALFAIRESYELSPDGEVGQGPRFSCGIVAGMSWGGPAGSSATRARAGANRRDVDFY